jgi:GT2 family glycosyltransferase
MYDLALIILNYNSGDDTIKCVEQLKKLKGDFYIIIVDNMSTDGSLELIENRFKGDFIVDIVCSPQNKGYSAGNNVGIKFAINKYKVSTVGILNPDVIISELQVINKMKSSLWENDKYAICGSSVLDSDNKYNPNFSSWNIPSRKDLILNYFLKNRRRYKKSVSFYVINNNYTLVDCVAGCFFLAKVKILQEINFLDEHIFLYNEENVLGWKLKQLGYKEILVLDQFYVHNHKKNQQHNMSLKKKITMTSNGYKSRKYLCNLMYGRKLIPLLALIEGFNKVILLCAYIKWRIKSDSN